ncbi:XRE family transcriptional regulator [Bifidobacterium pseudolongum]|uniref:XRE family transcriptional regulator n=1 Tax=Bifidobacterium pseudolongum TaxID=1694 RepID=A0A4S4F5S7_9BIFI|nr:helix-turn-helix domain-containing protein [Bifidobacterium pseudolongum]THG24036.1 XRE family transcriptional regulator [Bifidobacterium pseudolongum]
MENAVSQWMRSQSLTYRSLANQMGQSSSNIWKKVNGKMAWQPADLRFLHDTFGLSSDFVLGLDGEAGCTDARLGMV